MNSSPPASVVRYMVEVLAPTEGRILDPACCSGGMFVQTAHYIEKHKAQGKQMNLRAYGVEKTGATVRLAKMNLVLNNVRGTITHANSYYRDPYDSLSVSLGMKMSSLKMDFPKVGQLND